MRNLLSLTGLVPMVVTLLAACSGDPGNATSSGNSPEYECVTASDCGVDSDCQRWLCEIHKCVVDYAPAGVVVTSFSNPPPTCKRQICDGQGGKKYEPDPNHTEPNVARDCRMNICDDNGNPQQIPDAFDIPQDEPADCKVNVCDASGNPTKMPDPADVPPDQAKDCKRDGCDTSGNVTKSPDPSDVPDDISGDCRKFGCDASGMVIQSADPTDPPADRSPGDCQVSSCDANGNGTLVPGSDPPQPTFCATYACQNGAAVVDMAKNVGQNCSDMGYACSSSGLCDVCPGTDNMCTEIGPGVGAHTKATAYDFGPVSICDGSGSSFCGRLDSDAIAYFRYFGTGMVTLCSFDPHVQVSASGLVTLCQYFNCPTVNCGLGLTSSTLDGYPGCCSTGLSPSMDLNPSCSSSDVFFTIEPVGFSCINYEASFHS